MAYLLFMDESGHDHKKLPYEVRGGIAIHSSQLWSFVQAVQSLQVQAFGVQLDQFKKEFKGQKLLDKDRFKWAKQDPWFDDEERRKLAKAFLNKGLEKKSPTRAEFTAYGQASLEMARGIFQLLHSFRAVLFAAAVPRAVERPITGEPHEERLRKDHVFLFERFYYFLEERRDNGLLVMDQVEEANDRRFVRRMEAYFVKTATGRYRTAWIVPLPMFVSSAMNIPVQVADVCIYCINWGFRLDSIKMDAPTRPEIADEFGPWLNQLQFKGEGYRNGVVFKCFGITHVPDPYSSRT